MGHKSETSSSASSSRIALWSATAALAGLLFGFDVAVISGAEKAIQAHWALDSVAHGLLLSAALWGTVAGALGGSWPTDRLGRRPTLVRIGMAYVVASLGSALAVGPVDFALFRFLGGLAIGVSSITVPAYISEIAPPDKRGQLGALYQFNIVLGILVAYFSNWVIGATAEPADGTTWRWMLGIQALPSMLYLAASLALPESPVWLAGRSSTNKAVPVRWGDFLVAPLRRQASLAFAIALFNQLSGINAVVYFAPRIFEEAGLATSAALLASLGIGVVNLVATGIAVLLIDRLGRRTLMLIGSAGYCVSLGAIAIAFAAHAGAWVAPLVFLFIAAHAIGQGAVIWVFIAEVFPAPARARGQTIGCGTHWLLAALVAFAIPPALATFPPAALFGFFFAMMVLQFGWVIAVMPETRGALADGDLPLAGH
jgi:MFS family permease